MLEEGHLKDIDEDPANKEGKKKKKKNKNNKDVLSIN
jgi:hypothetical protein